MNENIFFQLMQTAKYAQLSNSAPLLRECYGAAKMAYQLQAISKTEFYELNTATVYYMNTHPQLNLI